ncbi:head-tail connector protein [Tissierella sp.]|uniref:head-tail connector protein n=1 Tax=Tissierella sp. TaxID=41274 RepID=UPI00304FCFED
MLETIKNELGIDDNDSNDIIQDLIDAGKADLILSGVHKDKAKDADPLIKRAIILYCKANYRYDPFTERYQELYTSLKHHLTLSVEYTEVVE